MPPRGILFVIVGDSLLGAMCKVVPRGVVCACADDIAAIVENTWHEIVKLAFVFEELRVISIRVLKPKKCAIVPLWVYNSGEGKLGDIVPSWALSTSISDSTLDRALLTTRSAVGFGQI